MKLAPVKTPLAVKKIFPNYVWDIPTTKKELYLTFDDGPTPEITNFTLKTLKNYNAKATFFCIGANIKKHPDIFKTILKEGHAVGNHTQYHIKGWKTETNTYLNEVKEAQLEIDSLSTDYETYNSTNSVNQKEEAHLKRPTKGADNKNSKTKKGVKLFRPPYGQIKPKQGKQLMALGYRIIMWDILSFDWEQEVSEKQCLTNILSHTKPGSIIVFHDSVKASKNMMFALPKVLEQFSKDGYTFKTLS